MPGIEDLHNRPNRIGTEKSSNSIGFINETQIGIDNFGTSVIVKESALSGNDIVIALLLLTNKGIKDRETGSFKLGLN